MDARGVCGAGPRTDPGARYELTVLPAAAGAPREGIMTLRRLVLLAMLALGVALLVVVPLSPVPAADPCCNVIKFDPKTRIVTVRALATGKTYQCIVPAAQDGSLLKPGVKVEVDTKTAQASTSCGGWNGPLTPTTKPTPQPTPTPKPTPTPRPQ